MKLLTISIVVAVAVASVFAMPAQEDSQSENTELLTDLDYSENNGDLISELVRDKRQYGGN